MSEKPAVILDMDGLPLSYSLGELRLLFDLLARTVDSPRAGAKEIVKAGETFFVRHGSVGLFDGYGEACSATVVYQLKEVSEAEFQNDDSPPGERIFQVVKVIAIDIRAE